MAVKQGMKLKSFSKNILEYSRVLKKSENDYYRGFVGKERKKVVDQLTEIITNILGPTLVNIYQDLNVLKIELSSYFDDDIKLIHKYFCEIMNKELKRIEFIYYHEALKGTVTVKDVTVSLNQVNIFPSIKGKIKKIDLLYDCDSIEHLEEVDQFLIIYLLLMEEIGEQNVISYIGNIQKKNNLSFFKKRFPLNTFSEYLNNIIRDEKWQDAETGNLPTTYYENRKNKSLVKYKDILYGISLSSLLASDRDKFILKFDSVFRMLGIQLITIVIDKYTDETIIETDLIREQINTIISYGNKGEIINSSTGNRYDYFDIYLYDETVLSKIITMCEDKKVEINLI